MATRTCANTFESGAFPPFSSDGEIKFAFSRVMSLKSCFLTREGFAPPEFHGEHNSDGYRALRG